MQDLADENVTGLADFGFYTSAREGDLNLSFVSLDDAKFTFENDRSTLTFGIAPDPPYRIQNRVEIGVSDPAYYLGIMFAGPSDITLENAPPNCGVELIPPKTMSDDVAAELYSLGPDVLQLPAELAAKLRGVQGAIVVTCEGAR